MSRFILLLNVVLSFIVTVCLFGLTGTVIYHIITNFNPNLMSSLYFLSGIGFFVVGFLIIMHFTVAIAFIASILRLRMAHAARQSDSMLLPECAQQPDLRNTLRDGEVLHLRRTNTLVRSFRQMGMTALRFLILFILIEACFILATGSLSAWFGSHSGLSQTPAPTLTIIDWLVLAYPVILFGPSLIATSAKVLQERRWQLRADDTGITLQIGRQRRFIAWNMIQAVVQSKATFTQRMLSGTYQLISKDGSIFPFTIDEPLLMGEKSSHFNYTDGYEGYIVNSGRLLATIRARSMIALRYNILADKMMRQLRRRLPLASINKDTILTSPVADASWQPAVIAASVEIEKIKVSPRLSSWKIFWQGMLWESIIVIGIGILLSTTGAMSQLSAGITQLRYQSVTIPTLSLAEWGLVILTVLILLIICGLFVGLSLSLGFVFAQTTQRRRMPQLSITPDGIINMQKQNNSQPSVIAWKDIQAWFVLPASGRHSDDTYMIVHGENQKLYWRANHDMELAGRRVAGDRKIAFQEKLIEAHRIIAARTGLALRLVTSEE